VGKAYLVVEKVISAIAAGAFPLRRQGGQSLKKKLNEKQIHITKIKQCKYVTAAGNVTAGVCVSLASSEPIEF